MPDTYVSMPDGSYVQIPENATPDQLNQFKQKFSSYVDKQGIVNSKGVSTYMPSEGIGSSGMRSQGTASQQALMQRKPAFALTPEQRANLGPLGSGTSPQPMPQGLGYDLARGGLSFIKNEPGATVAKGYYQSDPGSYERLQNDKGFAAEAKRTAVGALEPDQLLPLLAASPALSLLPKPLAMTALGMFAANQGKQAYDKYQEGDPGAAAFQALLGGAAGLGMKKMMTEPKIAPTPYSPAEDMIKGIENQGATVPDVTTPAPKPPKLTKAQKAEIQKALNQAQAARPEIQRLQQMNVPEEIGARGPASVGPDVPIIRLGRTGKGASPTAPTLPLASEFDQSQPLWGAEGPAKLGNPPFKTTYQGTAPPAEPIPPATISPEPITFQQFINSLAERAPKSQGEPSQVSGAQPFQLEPNFRPDDTTMSFQDWLDTFQGKGPLSAKQPFTTSKVGVTAKPGENPIQKQLPPTPAPESPPSTGEGQAPPVKKGPTIKTKGTQSGAFDTEVLRDIADRARDIFDETASFTKRTAPIAFQKAKEYDNAPETVQANLNKINVSVRDMTPENKKLFQTMLNSDKQLARGVAPAVREDLVRRYFQQPDVQTALPKYKQAVDEVYSPLRTGAGYGEANLTGKYSGAWSPSVAESHLKEGGIGPSAPGSKPLFVANKIQGEQQFTGTGQYHPDLEFSHQYRLSGLTRASGQRQVLSALKDAGALKPVPENFDGTMEYKGQTVPAQAFPLEQLGLGPKDLIRIGLPEKAIIPARIAREIRTPFEKSMNPGNAPPAGNVMGNVMKAYLYSTGELGAHAVTLPSIAGATTEMGSTGFKGLDAILNAVGPIRNMARMKDMVGLTKFSPEDVTNARVLGAKAGVYRENPLQGKVGMEKVKAIASSPGTAALYGNRGLFNNVVTGMVKVMKSNGATDSQIQEALSRLPNKSGSFVPDFQRVAERVLGPGFYSTGKAALKAGYGSLTPKKIVGGLVFYEALTRALDEDHKSWWERGLMPGEFIRGTDSSGKQMKWDSATLDRTFRVMREIPGRVWQEAGIDIPNETPKEKTMRVGETGVNATINQITRPIFSGPTVAMLSGASGVAPYAVKSSDYTGPKALNTAISKLPYDDRDRVKALVEALLPGSQAMMGDTNSEYRSNAPEDTYYQNINRLLRAVGQMPGKTWDPESAYRGAVMLEYGTKSGSVKGRKRAALEAQAKAGR